MKRTRKVRALKKIKRFTFILYHKMRYKAI
nr:MAG TPA: hypothetical protein [Caudoviricetes sp.]